MIIRVLGEGQFRVEDVDHLNVLDGQLEDAVDASDDAAFAEALRNLLAAVREEGRAVPDAELVVSDLVLPHAEASLDDVRAMLGDEGLIPG
jgi:PspA-Associated protein